MQLQSMLTVKKLGFSTGGQLGGRQVDPLAEAAQVIVCGERPDLCTHSIVCAAVQAV